MFVQNCKICNIVSENFSAEIEIHKIDTWAGVSERSIVPEPSGTQNRSLYVCIRLRSVKSMYKQTKYFFSKF
jgi:hypothetical protein